MVVVVVVVSLFGGVAEDCLQVWAFCTLCEVHCALHAASSVCCVAQRNSIATKQQNNNEDNNSYDDYSNSSN